MNERKNVIEGEDGETRQSEAEAEAEAEEDPNDEEDDAVVEKTKVNKLLSHFQIIIL